MKYGTLIDYKHFTNCPSIFSKLYQKEINIGMLDSLSGSDDSFSMSMSYKVFLIGKTGVGKTKILLKIMNSEIDIQDNHGLQVYTMHWPAKIIESKKTVLFEISFWDVGEQTLNTYNHILPSCFESLDAALYTFSFNNLTTWSDVPKLISRTEADDRVLKIGLGTVASRKQLVTGKMIQDFEEVYKIPVLKFDVDVDKGVSFLGHMQSIDLFMNKLCEMLWYRDQVRAGVIPRDLIDYLFHDTEETVEEQRNRVTFC